MTQFTLSSSTQALIEAALASPGTNNANYRAAYNAISAEITAHPGVNSGTAYWFSQAGTVNGQAFSPSASGTYIWAFTKAAAATFGDTITDTELQTASDRIARTVFLQIEEANFVFDDTASGPNNLNFSPAGIVQNDAGAGIGYLQSLFPNLDYSVWGGTLFARTVLGDSSYVSDYNLNLTPGSSDCNAIFAGNVAGIEASALQLLSSPGLIISQVMATTQQDRGILEACTPVPTTPLKVFPSLLNFNQYGQISSQTTTLASGGSSTTYYIYNDIGDMVGGVTASQDTPYSPTVITTVSLANGSSGSGYSANYMLNGTPSVQVGVDTTLSAAGSGPAVLVGAGNTVLNGAAGQTVFISLGNGDTINDSSDNGTDSDVDLEGNGDIAKVGANVSLTDDGVGNSISAGAGAILNIAGSSGTYVLAANATVTDTSANNTISTGQNSTVDVDADNVSLTNTGSGCTDGIHCAGDIVNSTGNTVNIGDNDSVTVNGSSDTITPGAGDNLDVAGDQNAISADDGSVIDISGTDNTVGVDSNSVVNVYGSNITLNADSSSNTTAWGDNNAAYISGSGGTVGFGGNTENAFISNGNVNLNQNNNSVTVYGNNDTEGSVWSGDTFGFEGTNENANFSNGTVNIDQPNESVTVSGDNDTANSSFTGDTLGFGGNTENAYISNGTVNLNNNDNSVTVYGNDDTEGSVWSGDTFGFAGTNENAYFSNGTVNIDQANDSVTTWGDNDTANSSYSGDSIGFGGNNDIAYVSNGTVNIDQQNNSVTVWGSNDDIGSSLSDDEVDVNGGGNNLTAGAADDVNLSGGGNTISATTADHLYLSNTGTDFDTVEVSDDTASGTDAIGNAGGIYLGANVDVTVSGDNNSLPFGGAAGCTVNVNGGGNDITAEADDHVYLSDTGANVDTVDVSNDTANATDANGDAGGIYLGSNVDVTVNGDNNSLPFAGATGCLVDVYGNNNTIASGADNAITINSAFSTPDTLDVSDDVSGDTTVAGPSTSGIVIDANAAANIDGSGSDTVYLGANSYLGLLNGAGYTVDASDGAILAAQATISFVLYGNDTQIYTGVNDSFVVSGGSNTITAQAGDVIDVENNSVSDLDNIDVTADQAGIFLGVNAAANVTGNSDIVNLQNGAYAGLLGSTGDAVFGANGTIATTSDTNFDLTGGDGSNDLVQLGPGSDVTLEGGSGYNVDGQDSIVDATANTNFNLDGGNNSDDIVYLSSYSYAGLLGGSGYTVDATGSADTVDTSANTSFSFSGSYSTLNPNTGSTVTFTSGQQDDFNGSSIVVDASAGTNFNLNGGSNSNDQVYFSGSGGYIGLPGGSGYDVNGTGDIVSAQPNTSFNLAGGNDSVYRRGRSVGEAQRNPRLSPVQTWVTRRFTHATNLPIPMPEIQTLVGAGNRNPCLHRPLCQREAA